MRVSFVAKRLAQFRTAFAPGVDKLRSIHEMRKYYRAMLDAGQVELVISEPGAKNAVNLIASCEVWFIRERDIELIKRQIAPKDISTGDIAYIANVTIDPNFEPVGIYWYFRKLLKMRHPKIQRVFWHNRGRQHFTQIFKVQRCH